MAGRIFDEKKKKAKGNIFYFLIILFLLFGNLFAQQTNNLEVIWQKTSPESVFIFGRCIASGDVNGDGYSDIMIVGDSVVSYPGQPYLGKCWIFYGGPNLDTIPDVQLLNTERVKFSALHSDDINGDGFDDVIIGAFSNLNAHGEVLLFMGGSQMDSTCDYKLHRDFNFGLSVASGDINGDGFADLIVGSAGPDWHTGRVYIYYGGPIFDTIPDVILNGGHENDIESFGSSLSGSGDVNNNGFDDIIVGAWQFGMGYQGRIYIYFGGNPMDTIYDMAMMGESVWHTLGWWDVDFIKIPQGFDYAITGCPLWGPFTPPEFYPGKVYVWFGGDSMDSIPDICLIGRTDSSWLGNCTRSAGDINNSLYDGLIASAPVEHYYRGTVYIWLGRSLIDTVPDAWIRGVQANEEMGYCVASAGDVDGDGRDEIMVSWAYPNFWENTVLVCKYTGVGIEEGRQPLTAVRLPLEIRPNPARTFTAIRFPLSADRTVIKIYGISGKLVKTFDARSKRQKVGNYEIRWDLRDENRKRVSNGIYFVEVTTENSEEKAGSREQKIRTIKKIVITK